MTHAVVVALAFLGIVGQVLVGLLLAGGLAWLAGARAPLDSVRAAIAGHELLLAFVVTAIATGGSLFFSEAAGFVPCELCWFQRIAMYPLVVTTILAFRFRDRGAARYLLPLPVAGAGVSVYHLLVENGVVEQTQACLTSAPGGCATRWVDEFGYVTIPTLALTAFALVFALLLSAARGAGRP